MSEKCLDAEKTNEYLKKIILQSNGDQEVVEVMLKGWIEHVWKEHGVSCISQIIKCMLALTKEGLIPEDCSRRMNVYLMGLDWDFAALSGPGDDLAIRRENTKQVLNPSLYRSGQNDEENEGERNQGDGTVSCLVQNTAVNDSDRDPRPIMEFELEALTGVTLHRNSGSFQGRMREDAVRMLEEYWPQGFNSRKMPVMIAWEFDEVTTVSKKTSREISFAPVSEEIHKSLINRMQTACCLRLLFSEANTSKIGSETFLRLGYRTIRSMLERLVMEQRETAKDPAGQHRDIALAWGEKNLKAVLDNQPPEWVTEAEQWALASLESIDDVEASDHGNPSLHRGESSSGETTMHNRAPKGKRPFATEESNRTSTPKKKTRKLDATSASPSKQGAITPPLTRSMAVVQHHQLQKALELSMSTREKKR